MTGGATFHEEFSSRGIEPVAAPLTGFRCFAIEREGAEADGSEIGYGGVVAADERVRGGLTGTFKTQYRWGTRKSEAVCLRAGRSHIIQGKQHELLMPECACGLWAFTTGDHNVCVRGSAALAIVQGWGRIVVGTSGFRAQYGRIVALTFPHVGRDQLLDDNAVRRYAGLRRVFREHARGWVTELDDLQRTTVALYDVPVFRDAASMLAAHPLTDLTPLLPDEEPDEIGGDCDG